MGADVAVNGMRIFLLGGFRLSVGSQPIDDAAWHLRKARALIKLLALTPGHRLHREQVLSALWPDLSPEAGLNNLYQVIHVARRALAGTRIGKTAAVLSIRDHIVTLDPPMAVWVDVEAFEQAAARAIGTDDVGAHEAALDLYTAELLPDDRYEDWTRERRESLSRRYLSLLLNLARLHENARDLARATAILQQVVATEPAHEDAHVGLMRLYALTGQRQAAVQQFQDLARALRELDAEPQAGSNALYRAILSGQAILAGPGGAVVRETEALRSRRASRTALRTRQGILGNLPAPLSSFIGRERELSALKDLLRETRLLTLTGPGGCGKTRLSLELAAAVRDRIPDGVWWIDLQALGDPALVPQAVASALGVREAPGRIIDAVLAERFRGLHLLLLFDNCEHLLTACAALIEALLRECPRLQVLATSRERLGVSGETRWLVPPLTTPSAGQRLTVEQIRAFEAVRLFEARSRSVRPGFSLDEKNAAAAAELCRRLDGLPLAIELAASRTHVLSVEQVLERLHDRFALLTAPSRARPRYRTLVEAIDWSYRLLSDAERGLFARLAVFAGSFTLEAVQGICAGAPVEREHILDLLGALVDQSFVLVSEDASGEVRYRLLETIREYALQKLAASGEESTMQSRHRDWYFRLAWQGEPVLDWAGWADWAERIDTNWLERMEGEHDDLRAAFDRTIGQGDGQRTLLFANALWELWCMRGHWTEARRKLEAALSASTDAPQGLRLQTIYHVGRLAQHRGDFKAAVPLLEESLRLARELNDWRGIAEPLVTLGYVASWRSDYPTARRLFEEALTLFGGAAANELTTRALRGLGDLALREGNLAAARPFLEDARRISQTLHNNQSGAESVLLGASLADSLHMLGQLEAAEGRFNLARLHFEESLKFFVRAQIKIGVAASSHSLGTVEAEEGNYDGARVRLERALELYREVADTRNMTGALVSLALVAQGQQRHRDACTFLSEALLTCREMQHLPGLGSCVYELAALASSVELSEHAARLYGAGQAIRARAERPWWAVFLRKHSDYDRSLLRKHLGERASANIWAEGQGMTTEQATEYALSVIQTIQEAVGRRAGESTAALPAVLSDMVCG